MPEPRRRLPPELTKPLEPLVLGLLMDDERRAQLLAERSQEIVRRLDLLAKFYRIKPGPGPDSGLLLALMLDRIPGRAAGA